MYKMQNNLLNIFVYILHDFLPSSLLSFRASKIIVSHVVCCIWGLDLSQSNKYGPQNPADVSCIELASMTLTNLRNF